jgi:MFS family permease
MSLILTTWAVGGMVASLGAGKLSDKMGRAKILLLGAILGAATPFFYSYATTAASMSLIYGLNGISFWIVQTVGFVFSGDLIHESKRGRMLSRYNAVMALSWGPTGLLIGGPLADLQVKTFGFSSYTAYVNMFHVSSIIVA